MQTTQPALPADTPTPAFAGGPSRDDPMRNFGYTVSAYGVLWCVLLAFVFLGWRRQSALNSRIDELEAALARAAKGSGGGK